MAKEKEEVLYTAQEKEEVRFVKTGDIVNRHWIVGDFIRTGKFNSFYFEVTDRSRPIQSYTMKVPSIFF